MAGPYIAMAMDTARMRADGSGVELTEVQQEHLAGIEKFTEGRLLPAPPALHDGDGVRRFSVSTMPGAEVFTTRLPDGNTRTALLMPKSDNFKGWMAIHKDKDGLPCNHITVHWDQPYTIDGSGGVETRIIDNVAQTLTEGGAPLPHPSPKDIEFHQLTRPTNAMTAQCSLASAAVAAPVPSL